MMTIALVRGVPFRFCGTLAIGAIVAVSTVWADDVKPQQQKPAQLVQVDADQAEKKNDDDADATEKNEPQNPFGRLIRDLLPDEKERPDRLIPKNNTKPLKEPGADDDDTASDDSDEEGEGRGRRGGDFATRLLNRAKTAIEEKNYRLAIEALQLVLDQPQDSIIPTETGVFHSARVRANRMLAGLPPDILDRYRTQYGAAARQMYREAMDSGRMELVVEVAERYANTEAGQEALDYLGTWHLYRGEYALASMRFALLQEFNSPLVENSRWQLKAAMSFRRAGREAECESLIAALSANAPDGLLIRGERIDPIEWLEKNGQSPPPMTEFVNEWPMFGGRSNRTAKVTGSDPVLISRWSHPLSLRESLRDQIDQIAEDLADLRRATVPVISPLLVDGKAIYRTLRGVQVVDVRSGKTLWETPEGVSAERLLTGQTTPNTGGEFRIILQGANPFGISTYSGSDPSRQPLTGLLFRNGLWGMLSSDGHQLYLIDDQALLANRQPGYSFNFQPNRNDPVHRDWSSNRLTAYDLNSGRPVWSVGGERMDEPFDLPLAGTYFFGAPLVNGGELFAIGEVDDEIRLFVIDAETGKPKWSQLLDYSPEKIEKDLGRRWWTAQVALSHGVLICPTTTGRLVAVDRMTHAVLWAQKVGDRSHDTSHMAFVNRRNAHLVPWKDLNERWCPSAPIIADGRVVFTPPESEVVYCHDLVSGQELWKLPKDRYLYLAGIFDGTVVLVGTDRVGGYTLAEGKLTWSLDLPADARPSGIGIAVGGQYHLPLQSGQLWTLDLETGDRLGVRTTEHRQRLGNLGLYEDVLVSVGPAATFGFELEEPLQALIKELKSDEDWNKGALLEAKMYALAGEHDLALSELRSVRREQLNSADETEFTKMMVSNLSAVILSDLDGCEAELAELQSFVQDDLSAEQELTGDRLQFRRLFALHLERRQEYQRAFEVYWSFLSHDDATVITRLDDDSVKVSARIWLAGRFRDLWELLPTDVQADLGTRISERAARLPTDNADRERFASLFAFHPSSVPVVLDLAEQWASRGEFVRAQLTLQSLVRRPDRSVSATGLIRQAELLAEFGLKQDAAAVYQRLAGEFADATLSDGRTVASVLASLDEADRRLVEPSRPGWGEFNLSVSHGRSSYYSSTTVQDLELRPESLPFYDRYRFQVLHNQGRLAVYNNQDASLYWLLPLRNRANSSQGRWVAADANGHELIVLHNDMLHALSPVERKILWTRPVDVLSSGSSFYRRPDRSSIRNMQPIDALTDQGGSINPVLNRHTNERGMLAVVDASYVCLYGRRRFSIIDAATGDVRWSRDNLPIDCRVYGNEHAVFLLYHDASEPVALRASDGKPIEIARLNQLLRRTIRVSSNGLVLLEQQAGFSLFGLKTGKAIVRLYDPIDGTEYWRRSYPINALFSQPDSNTLAVLTGDGTFELVDLRTGEASEMGHIDDEHLESRIGVQVVLDHDQVYLIVNRARTGSTSYYSQSLPTTRVNGTVLAFDRRSGRALWNREVVNQQLILSHFETSPVLIFATSGYVRNEKVRYSRLNLLVIDRKTGRKLVDNEFKSAYSSGLRMLDVNLPERYIELRSYYHRIRLSAEAESVSRSSDEVGGN